MALGPPRANENVETQQGSRGRSPCGGSARGHLSLKPFLFRAEQRESDAQPYASFSWEFLTAVPATTQR
jgi:hypothetical protein